jgi:hypothetical protein
MATHLTLTVDIDVPAVLNLAAHVDLAVESCIMTCDEARDLIRCELNQFVRARA